MTIYNIKTQKVPKGAIFIGRPSKWGNPYVLGKDGTRDEVIARYGEYIIKLIEDGELDIKELADLYDMDLVCFCAPLPCHGHMLEKLSREAAKALGYL